MDDYEEVCILAALGFFIFQLALLKRGETSLNRAINTDEEKKSISMCSRCLGWSYFPMECSWKSIRGGLVLSLLATFIIINPPPPWQVLMSPGMWLAIHSFITTNYHPAEQEVADAFVSSACGRLNSRRVTAPRRLWLRPRGLARTSCRASAQHATRSNSTAFR